MLNRTGFVHMNGRVYDPRIGRFVSPDPFVPDAFNSQSCNRYSYVNNTPLSATDPSGYFGTWLDIAGIHSGPGIGIIDLGGGFEPSIGSFNADIEFSLPAEWTQISVPLSPVFEIADVVADSVSDRSVAADGFAETTFRWIVYDYQDPLFGSHWWEAAAAIPALKPLKLGKILKALPSPKGIYPKPTADNARLQAALDQLFREGDTIVGGTAGAVRHEPTTGALVGGRSHITKAQERVRQLEKILQRESLSPADRATATRVLGDLQDALNTTRVHP